MDLLILDPGINTGYAMFSKKKLVDHGVIRGKGEGFIEKSANVIYQAHGVFHMYTGERVVIEFPSFQNLAAKNTGSIIKLAYVVGRLFELAKTYELTPELLNVSEWRGQIPKELVWKRAEKYFGLKEKLVNHSGDCVGIAQYLFQKKLDK